MDAAEARGWIERHTASDQHPVLTADEVEELLGSALSYPTWRADFEYPAGSTIMADDRLWYANFGGFSGATTPTWIGDVTDGYVQWVDAGEPEYDLYGAAARGWELKAAKIATDYDYSIEGGTWNRSQAYRHALEMAAMHGGQAASLSGSAGGTLGIITARAPVARYRLADDRYLIRSDGGDRDPRYR